MGGLIDGREEGGFTYQHTMVEIGAAGAGKHTGRIQLYVWVEEEVNE